MDKRPKHDEQQGYESAVRTIVPPMVGLRERTLHATRIK